ncbi:MAG: hypothetical protein F9K46_15615, partial [Anaerolineae bacterium]
MIRVIGFFGVVLMLLSGTLAYARRDEPEQWIAFISDRDGNAEIYRMRPDGSDVQQLTHTGNNTTHCSVRWSWRGDRIFFTRTPIDPQNKSRSCFGNNPLDMYEIHFNGSRQHLVKNGFGILTPDGRWSIVGVFDPNCCSVILKIDMVTGQQVRLAEGSYPQLSPDGQWVAFTDPQQLFLKIVSVETGKVIELLSSTLFLGGWPSFGWSPDSQEIIFAGTTLLGNIPTSLYRINIDKRQALILKADAGVFDGMNIALKISPDAKWLAFVDMEQNVPFLKLLSIDTGTITTLTQLNSRNTNIRSILWAWSSDSQWIIFEQYFQEDNRIHLLRINLDDSTVEDLTPI